MSLYESQIPLNNKRNSYAIPSLRLYDKFSSSTRVSPNNRDSVTLLSIKLPSVLSARERKTYLAESQDLTNLEENPEKSQ